MAENLGNAFCSVYYQTFDSNRTDVTKFYHPDALMTFEGTQIQGQNAIATKLGSLPFQKVQHVVTTVDTQPIPFVGDGYLIHVIGQLKTDDDPPHGFSQSITVLPYNGSHVIVNDVFRLVLHHG